MTREIAPAWSPSQAAAQREAKRRSLFYASLNHWPFLGVLLTLLIAFMGTPVSHSFSPVDLAGAVHVTAQPKALWKDAIKIWVTRDERVYFRYQQVTLHELPELIRNAKQKGAEKRVYLAVDMRTKYSDVLAIVEQIRKEEISDICFLAQQAEK